MCKSGAKMATDGDINLDPECKASLTELLKDTMPNESTESTNEETKWCP